MPADAFLLLNEYDDGIVNDVVRKGQWAEIGGALVSSGKTAAIDAATPWSPSGLSSCSICTIELDLETAGGVSSTLVLEAFVQGKNSVELIVKESRDKLILRQRFNNLSSKDTAGFTIEPNQNYRVVLSHDGTNINVSVNGVAVFSTPAIGDFAGNVTLRVKKTTGTFRRLAIS